MDNVFEPTAEGSFTMRAFLSRDGVLLENPEMLEISYRLRADLDDGVEFIGAVNESGKARHIDDYHLPTVLHAFRRFQHDAASSSPKENRND